MSVDDQIEVKKIVKKSGSSFFWGMNVLDKEQRRAIFSVYAFCRIVDDIADEIKNKEVKKKKLKGWKIKINNLYNLKTLTSGVERELKYAIEKYSLEKSDFHSIIDGMMMDAKNDIKFPSKKDLELYCDRVAVAVGYLSIKIFGLSDKAKKYAFCLGRAFQLTNIIRDFYEDIKRERCYIPKIYFKKYGIKANINSISQDPKLQLIFQEILNEADNYYKSSLTESYKICKKKIIASEIMKTFYKAIHSKMLNRTINFKKKVRLNFFEKIKILLLFFMRY